MKEEILVKLENVSKLYGKRETEVRALDKVSLEIYKNDFATLCGPSGSGKTTLLNIIGALDKPSNGRIILEDKDISILKENELSLIRRHRIAFVFQAYNLIPTLTVYENVRFILDLQNWPKKDRQESVMSVLKEAGLDGLENRLPDQLSGGQQQRVAIARAIVSEPTLILADEPTANLDSAAASSLLELMEKLNNLKGVNFLFATHDERVKERAKRIIEMEDGRVVEN